MGAEKKDHPNSEHYTQQGFAFLDEEHWDEAEAAFRHALALQPGNLLAGYHLSRIYESRGKSKEGLRIWRQLLRHETDPELCHAVFKALLSYPDPENDVLFEQWRDPFGLALEELFADDETETNKIAKPAARLLLAKYSLSPNLDFSPRLLDRLATDRLFLAFLGKAINTDVDMELFLTRLRRHLLLTLSRSDSGAPCLMPLLAALAHQCFNNGYIFFEEPMEKRALDRLAKDPKWFETEYKVVLMALYHPLYRLPEADSLARKNEDAWPPTVRSVLECQLFQPRTEQELKTGIPSLSTIEDTTSRIVRTQYEEHPYPRWKRLRAARISLETLLRSLPSAPETPGFLEAPFTVLIAGCGTGQHPLSFARDNPGAEVLAIDLSRNSLAYANRMAGFLGIRNISFLHADLLALERLNHRFHHIESVGVLHHLASPERGWAALTDILEPGGTMRVGLYSERARRAISATRELIARRDLLPTPSQMKRFRRELMTRPEFSKVLEGMLSQDFFALNNFRDLVFHAMEHCFTIPRIREALDHMGFQFLGFTLDSQIRRGYAALFPEDPGMIDLGNWHCFEQRHPNTFFGMYQFLIQKPPAGK